MQAPSLPPRVAPYLPSRFALMVAAAGVVGGAVGAAYLAALALVEHALGPEHWRVLPHAVILVAVGVVIALITKRVGRAANVELLVDNIHVFGGSDDLRNLRSLIPISLLCVGSGGTLGPEAPLVQTTGALGGWMASRLGLDRRQFRILTITGMAAGFTTLFGAPIGAAVFALEIPHRRGIEHSDALLPACVGSLAGYGVYVVATGNGLRPIFDLPMVEAIAAVDLLWAAAAGLTGALVGYLFAGLVRMASRVAGILPPIARPAAAGLVLGLLAWWNPHALTNGELALHDLVTDHLAVGALLLAAAAKLAGSVVSMAGEWRGGFIIPLFFIGACLGSAVHVAMPATDQWVLVTAMMVGCNVAVTKTPLGSALVITEMAGIRLLPTVLVASLVALLLSEPIRVIDSQRRAESDEGDS